jgi:hypothetical protein
MTMIEVQLRYRIVSRSRNLRGMRDYARVSPVVRVECRKRNAHPKDPGGVISVEYTDGATCTADFASYHVMVDFVRNRRSWRGADVRYLDGNVGYLTSPGIIAG